MQSMSGGGQQQLVARPPLVNLPRSLRTPVRAVLGPPLDLTGTNLCQLGESLNGPGPTWGKRGLNWCQFGMALFGVLASGTDLGPTGSPYGITTPHRRLRPLRRLWFHCYRVVWCTAAIYDGGNCCEYTDHVVRKPNRNASA